jgi:hypothetical protein
VTIRPRLEHLEERTLLSINPIVTENQLPGTPLSVWGPTYTANMDGFASKMSVNPGETESFKVNTYGTVSKFRLDVYRLGYYQGNGARLVGSVDVPNPPAQPDPIYNASTGEVDAGNWAVDASWTVPSNAVSGIYFTRMVREDGVSGGDAMCTFVVRNDASHSDLLFKTSDATWNAYSNWGGRSLYDFNSSPSRAFKVSYNRPDQGWAFLWEYPMVNWLEQNGYDVSYFTDVDTEARGSDILNHKVFMSVGHDEYWSGGERNNVTAARDAGVNLAFFSGNAVYWKTRWEKSIDGTNTPNRTLVCYKETARGQDPADPPTWTGQWADPVGGSPADAGVPQNSLTGTFYTGGETNNSTSFVIPSDYAGLRFWRNTAVAQLTPGQSYTTPNRTLGYEWDADVDNGYRPAGEFDLSNTTVQGIPQNIALYRAASGALVFSAATVQWSWGLSSVGLGAGTMNPPDQAMQQATVNLFADMGVQPGTLQSGLVPASASTDHTPPTSIITSPANNSSVSLNVPITIRGTAVDAGGGVVAGVEVSVDGGATWHPANLNAVATSTTWTYPWTPTAAGNYNIRSRAVDDSANLETPSAGILVSAGVTPPILVASYSFDEGSGTVLHDRSGHGNNGTISNATWSTAGKYGGALSFNGTNAWVTINNSASLQLSNGMTLEAWVEPTAASAWRPALLKEIPGDLSYALYASASPAGSAFPPAAQINLGSGDLTAQGTAGLPLNTWSFMAATYDGSTLTTYINGNVVSTLAVSGAITETNGVLRIGGDASWNEHFQGLIDDVRIYNYALTQSAISTDMNTPVPGAAGGASQAAPLAGNAVPGLAAGPAAAGPSTAGGAAPGAEPTMRKPAGISPGSPPVVADALFSLFSATSPGSVGMVAGTADTGPLSPGLLFGPLFAATGFGGDASGGHSAPSGSGGVRQGVAALGVSPLTNADPLGGVFETPFSWVPNA